MEWGPLILAFVLIAVAYLYDYNLSLHDTSSAETQVIHGWSTGIQDPAKKVKRVAVG